MSLLNVGSRALLANQVALQTTGHNIANVSVTGYSRQRVALETVPGQFTGAGFIGKGVNVADILRNHNELLTRQAAVAQSVQASDGVRNERFSQMQNVFSGGPSGLGAAINDMLNSLGDVVSAPTDLTARTVTLTRMDEMAARMRSASAELGEISYSVAEQLRNNTTSINDLAKGIANINEQIAGAIGSGHSPNDLLDQRDQMIRDLSQYIQVTQIPASDGTVGIFVAGSQALVLGHTASQVSLGESAQFPGSGQMALFFNRAGAPPIELNENMLGGGETFGLLKFANRDLAEGRNLLGRMALAIGSEMNYQQSQGLTLDGNPGKPLFSTPAQINGYTTGPAKGSLNLSDPSKFTPSKFAASDYEVRFTAPPGGGQVVRLSDGKVTDFTDLTDLASQQIDGLTFEFDPLFPPAANERVMFQPFANAAANMQALVYSPRDLAAASPVNAQMGKSNAGTLQLAGIKASGEHWDASLNGGAGGVATTGAYTLPPTGSGVTLTFAADGTFTVNPPPANPPIDRSATPPQEMSPPYQYQSGHAITIDGWEITLQGTPKAGDSVTVGDAKDPQYGDWYTRNASNAGALRTLRDKKMFDESTLSDGYAGLMATVGTRAQSAQYAAKLSDSIANNLEADRSAISGVNLDEEAAKLIQYQQAYQASAKLLQIAQNIFDNLIQTMSR